MKASICYLGGQNHANAYRFHALTYALTLFLLSILIFFFRSFAKLSILILEGIIKKISYQRRDYESVDEKSLS